MYLSSAKTFPNNETVTINCRIEIKRILAMVLIPASLKIGFTSRISAFSSGKMDADKATLITEATTNNYSNAQKKIIHIRMNFKLD